MPKLFSKHKLWGLLLMVIHELFHCNLSGVSGIAGSTWVSLQVSTGRMTGGSQLAIMLIVILACAGVLYLLFQNAVILPARKIEAQVVRVALSLRDQGQLSNALQSLESLYERQYCFKQCLNLYGRIELELGHPSRALVHCLESMNSERSKCTNNDARLCLVDAYRALNQSEKLFEIKRELYLCRALSRNDSLELIEQFARQNDTGSILVLFQRYQYGMDADVVAILQQYGLGSLSQPLSSNSTIVSTASSTVESSNPNDISDQRTNHNHGSNTVDVSNTGVSSAPSGGMSAAHAVPITTPERNIVGGTLKESQPSVPGGSDADHDGIVSVASSLRTEQGDHHDHSNVAAAKDTAEVLTRSVTDAAEATKNVIAVEQLPSQSETTPVEKEKSAGDDASAVSNPAPASPSPSAQSTTPSAPSVPSNPQEDQKRRAARSYLTMAQSYLLRGDLVNALKQVTTALKKVPNYDEALFVRSQIHLHNQQIDLAEADLVQVFVQSANLRGNFTAGEQLLQVATYRAQQQQRYAASAAIFAHLMAYDDEWEANNTTTPSPYLLQENDLLLYAQVLAQTKNYTGAISVLDKGTQRFHAPELNSSDANDERSSRRRRQWQQQVIPMYLTWYEAMGDFVSAENVYREGMTMGIVTAEGLRSFFLRTNQTERALGLYYDAISGYQAELQTLNNSMGSVAQRKELQRVRESLGHVHKQLGQYFHETASNLTAARRHFQEALELGVYDVEVRRFFALHGLALVDAASSAQQSAQSAVSNNTESVNTTDSDADHHQLRNESTTDHGVQPETSTSSKTAFHPAGNRWVVRRQVPRQQARETSDAEHELDMDQLQQLMSQLLQAEQTGRVDDNLSGDRETASSAQGSLRSKASSAGGLEDVLKLLQLQQDGQSVEGSTADASWEEEDDVIRDTDSVFERQRKLQMQQQKEEARREEAEKQRRRQEALGTL